MNKKISVVIQGVIAAIGIGFGLLTIFIGGQTLLGYSDPGYVVFLPLLIFNIVMGLVYVVSGFMIWRYFNLGITAAKMIFLINFTALILILVAYFMGGNVATESLKAMSFRTVIWLLLWGGLLWIRE